MFTKIFKFSAKFDIIFPKFITYNNKIYNKTF